jgi:hypothetical protein
MDIAAALVANHAEIEGDKLYISGGAWAWLQVPTLPQAMIIQLAMVLVAEPDENIDSVLVRSFIRDGEGKDTYGTELLVNWPKAEGLKPGQPIVVPVVLNVPFTVQKRGRHSLEIFLDYDGTSRKSVPFAVAFAGS